MKKTLKEFADFLETLLYDRFENIQEINNSIGGFLGFDVLLELTPQENTDFQLLANFSLGDDSKELYLDLYYLVDRQQRLYLTHYDLDSEHPLDDNDLEMYILGIDK